MVQRKVIRRKPGILPIQPEYLISYLHEISEIQRQPMSPLLGKSPSSAPATPQKSLPNYMKSTTSSEARKEKERSPVSKSLNLDNKMCTDCKPYPARKSTRTWSSKKKTSVRALTKAPSFKTVRKSTCSSTMKDSKFPPYLVLDDGGSEAEGTSALKVCPYTYCSLNGHHRPPLNCFLKAKRRSLKAQTSVKLGSLFPMKPVGSSDSSQDEADLFIEIYSEKEDIKVDLSQEDTRLVDEHNLIDEIPDPEEQFGGASYGEEEQMERNASMEEDDKSSEATEMEWEQGPDSASRVDDEGNLCSKGGALFSVMKKPEIVELDDISSCCTEEVLAEELLRELFEEETSEDGGSEAPLEEKGDRDFMVGPIQMDFIGGSENDAVEANLKPQQAENDCLTETVAQCLDDELQQLPNGEPEKSVNNGLGVPDSSTGCSEGDQDCPKTRILKNIDAHEGLDTSELRSIGHEVEECCNTQREDCNKPTKAEALAAATNEGTCGDNGGMSGWARNNSKQELEDPCSYLKWKIGCRRAMDQTEETEREFNPREPTFLPLVPDPNAERVDLNHQTVDERKNSKEWMIDHALQEAVTKLASATRKRKVALLVEAFETVSPVPKYEPRMRHSSPVFSPTTPRPIQACS
ncbi:unnamed protein product [Linum trigynum]|uniref:Calmodulin-binding domain-containing protein n=2 Tax=Linum trigynum TaxID=586398 RepID=A0AAV2GNK2_9ROSI